MFARRGSLTPTQGEIARRTLTLPLRVKATPEIRLSVRAAFCLSAPLVVGLALNQRLYSIVWAIGALLAISQDGLDDWHVRRQRLIWVGVAGAVGVGLGATFVNAHSAPWSLVILFGAVALCTGILEASNRQTAGAYLLVGTIFGAGLEFRGKVWQSALAFVLGALTVFVVALVMNIPSRLSNQRLALARAFNTLANAVDAVGSPQFFAVRERAIADVDRAYDVIGSQRFHVNAPEDVALHQVLLVALRVGEVISYLEGRGLDVDPSMVSGLREIASILNSSNARSAIATLEDFPHRFQTPQGLNPVVVSALAPLTFEQLRAVTLSPESHVSSRPLLPLRERLRFGLILAVAISAATAISVVLADPHGFWLPLAVAFILRPDFGPVISRALARTVGTAIGVGIAALVALTGNPIVVLIGLSCVMAAIQPWAARRSQILSVVIFTPIIFIFLGLLGSEKGLFSARIVDTAIAAGIVLLLDVFVWTTAPSMRPPAQVATARAAAERYEREATLDDAMGRNRLRRAALRAVESARASLSRSRAEPRLLKRHDPTTTQLLDDVERSIDAHTAVLLRIPGGGAPGEAK